MLMFGLVKHRHSQCRCLTPVKKSTDLGSAMKCKIIIHVFIMPISQHVGPLELNLKPTRSYKYWISRQETDQGTIFASICIFTVRVHGQNMGHSTVWKFAAPRSSCHRLIWNIYIYELMPKEIGNSAARGPDKPNKSLAWNSVKYSWSCVKYPWSNKFPSLPVKN